MTLALAGVAMGLAASFTLTRLMKMLLFGISASDPLTFGGIALLLTAVEFLTCWIPARWAANEEKPRPTLIDRLLYFRPGENISQRYSVLKGERPDGASLTIGPSANFS